MRKDDQIKANAESKFLQLNEPRIERCGRNSRNDRVVGLRNGLGGCRPINEQFGRSVNQPNSVVKCGREHLKLD
jgi:hypothetical protein